MAKPKPVGEKMMGHMGTLLTTQVVGFSVFYSQSWWMVQQQKTWVEHLGETCPVHFCFRGIVKQKWTDRGVEKQPFSSGVNFSPRKNSTRLPPETSKTSVLMRWEIIGKRSGWKSKAYVNMMWILFPKRWNKNSLKSEHCSSRYISVRIINNL